MPKIVAARAAARLEDARILGRRLADARSRAGLSQAQAAKALAVPQSQIAKLELGLRQLRFIEGLRLATLYSISPIELGSGVSEERPEPISGTTIRRRTRLDSK
jgi:Helix-turn-helix.